MIKLRDIIESFSLTEKLKDFDTLSSDAQEVAKEIIDALDLDISDIKQHSKNRIAILSDEPRGDIFNALDKIGFERDVSISGSGIGGARHSSGVEVIVKPKTKRGAKSSGKESESAFITIIDTAIQDVGEPINVILKSSSNKRVIENVTSVKDASADASSRGYIKADVQLFSNGTVVENISLKQSNAVRWESLKARAWANLAFENFVKKALDGEFENIKLIPVEGKKGKYRMVDPDTEKTLSKVILRGIPESAIEQSIFGSDSPVPIIVKQTFDSSFSKYELNQTTLTIECDEVYTTIDHIVGTDAEPVAAFSHHINQKYGIEFRMFTRGLLYRGNTPKGAAIELEYEKIK